MRLDVLTPYDCEQTRLWRNQCLETLRTPYPLTHEQQEEFYREVISNPHSPHRYYAIRGECNGVDGPQLGVAGCFIGMGGLTNICWENRIAEISLIIDPEYRGKGLGEQAVDLLLAEGFDRLGLKTVVGEVYGCNPEGVKFWANVVQKYWDKDEPMNAVRLAFVTLHNRKFWEGRFWNGNYFEFDCDEWRKAKNAKST